MRIKFLMTFLVLISYSAICDVTNLTNSLTEISDYTRKVDFDSPIITCEAKNENHFANIESFSNQISDISDDIDDIELTKIQKDALCYTLREGKKDNQPGKQHFYQWELNAMSIMGISSTQSDVKSKIKEFVHKHMASFKCERTAFYQECGFNSCLVDSMVIEAVEHLIKTYEVDKDNDKDITGHTIESFIKREIDRTNNENIKNQYILMQKRLNPYVPDPNDPMDF